MGQSLTERLQETRLTVVEVDASHGRVRVRGAVDACTDLTCGRETVVLTDDGQHSLGSLNPGDIIRVEPGAAGPDKIVVVRRVWEEIASPEI